MMIENILRDASCSIACGAEQGTGYLVSEDTVLTARHCVQSAIESASAIGVTFLTTDDDRPIFGRVLAESDKFDVALIKLERAIPNTPISLTTELPREGEEWRSFGYPTGKAAIGHRLSGKIAHVLRRPRLRMDVDLEVDPTTVLRNYRGLSGSIVICRDTGVALLRLKIDGTLGAISIGRIATFLSKSGIDLAKNAAGTAFPKTYLGRREAFQQTFERLIRSHSGKYLFIEGAPGIGKTIFCNHFQPSDKTLHLLGTYSLRPPNSPHGAVYWLQPEILFDWLAVRISEFLTGRPARLEEQSYPKMVVSTYRLLQAWSAHCAASGQLGVFFLDGLNEAYDFDVKQLQQLLGLFPIALADKIVIVFTSPNFESLAAALGGRVAPDNVLQLPPLSELECIRYCRHELPRDKATPSLIRRLCEKALGHPLYLRYLIEFASAGSAGAELDEFPILTGPIEQYYDQLWSRLGTDIATTNLLALLARLRTGIAFAQLTRALDGHERSVLDFTTVKIRHLLTHAESTEIYHPSFAAFILERTRSLDQVIHNRLGEFCLKESAHDYCTTNLIYHLLRGGKTAEVKAACTCNQEWVDSAVLHGVDPDTLLSDIQAVLAASLKNGPATEVVRILLLMQRIGFRHNSLFAQSGQLVAEALIAVGRPPEALKHLIRYRTLIVDPEEALHVAQVLAVKGCSREALGLLQVLHRHLIEAPHGSTVKIGTFLRWSQLRIQTFLFARLAGAQHEMQSVMNVLMQVQDVCRANLSDKPEAVHECIEEVSHIPACYFLSFHDTYSSAAAVKEASQNAELPPHYLSLLCRIVIECAVWIDEYNLPKERRSFHDIFADLGSLRFAGGPISEPMNSYLVDTLIRFGAPSETVIQFGTLEVEAPTTSVEIRAENHVDVNFEELKEHARRWRAGGYISGVLNCPDIPDLSPDRWIDWLQGLISAIFWWDGRSRRAKSDGNKLGLEESRLALRNRLIPVMTFTLASRASWDTSYGIPESVLPWLYRCLMEVMCDCYPDDVAVFFKMLTENLTGQLGIYTEGYREAILGMIEEVLRSKVDSSVSESVLALLQRFVQYVISGVENRHELVPDLLRLMPLFEKLGAHEECARLYRHVLSVSMGPSWYKEDQLGLMTEILATMPASEDLAGRAQTIASYLERASGEMTFQRYVRNEKANFIGELFRRGMSKEGCRYFTQQSCGSKLELLMEAESGLVDKAGPLRGMRYPGGALDEQEAILSLVRNAKAADLKLRWALLEVFHSGDERHIADYAGEYAKLINEVGLDEGALSFLFERTARLVGSETSPQLVSKFVAEFLSQLDPRHRAQFEPILKARHDVTEPDVYDQKPPAHESSGDAPEVRPKSAHDRDDVLFAPGVFGRRAAQNDADALLAEAENQVKLGNLNTAQEKAIEMLKTLQAGEWGIWSHPSHGVNRAQHIIQAGSTDAHSILKVWSQLILNERHAPQWVIVADIIRRLSALFDAEDRRQLLDHILQHVGFLIGNVEREKEDYSYLASAARNADQSKDLFLLLLWLTDHPTWLRRQRAAAVIIWLVEKLDWVLTEAARLAFGAGEGYGPDVLCGVLDGLSRDQPIELWSKLRPLIHVEQSLATNLHFSRLAALHLIALRAAKLSDSSAREIIAAIEVALNRHKNSKHPRAKSARLPEWAHCIEREWNALRDSIPNMGNLANQLNDEMIRLCAPLSISELRALEMLVCKSFREQIDGPLDRWHGKVLYALNTALFKHVNKKALGKAAANMRITNPSMPELTMRWDFEAPGFKALIEGRLSLLTGTSTTFFLNYVERLGHSQGGNGGVLDVVAVLVPRLIRKKLLFAPEVIAKFSSVEIPHALKAKAHETCYSLEPRSAFFGSMTPGKPLANFEKLVKEPDTAFFRMNWRTGRRADLRQLGEPVSEGCFLSVIRDRLKLPPSKKLAWIIRFRGDVMAIIDENGSQFF